MTCDSIRNKSLNKYTARRRNLKKLLAREKFSGIPKTERLTKNLQVRTPDAAFCQRHQFTNPKTAKIHCQIQTINHREGGILPKNAENFFIEFCQTTIE